MFAARLRASSIAATMAIIASATPAMAAPRAPSFLALGGEVAAPRGFVDMCAAGVEREFCSTTTPATPNAAMVTASVRPITVQEASPVRLVKEPALPIPARALAFASLKVDPATIGGSFAVPMIFGDPVVASHVDMVRHPTDMFADMLAATRAHVLAAAIHDVATTRPQVATEAPALFLALAATASPQRPIELAAVPEMAAAPITAMPRDIGKLLRRVNRSVNGHVRQQSDRLTYGMDEVWRRSGTDSDARGDCEDIAIEKRIALIQAGVPAQALAFAVVYSHAAGLHTVLLARTADGDMVLDSRAAFVVPWSKAPYSWLAIQSREDPMVWRSLENRA